MTNSDRYWTVYCLGQDGHSTSLARFKWSLRVSLRATARDGPASEILARRPARVNPLRSLADLAQWPCPGTVIMPVMRGLLPRLPDVAPIRDIGPAAMRFKTCFKRNLSLFKRIIGPGTVMSKAGSVNPLRSSSVVSWPFCSEF